MYWYTIGQTLTQQEHAPAPEQPPRTAKLMAALCYLNVPEMEIEIWTQLLHHREKWVSEPMRIVIDHLRRCML